MAVAFIEFLRDPRIHYLPIVTTLLSAAFFAVLWGAVRNRASGRHLNWWAFGVLCYGLGTACEGGITLFGNSVFLTKAWYITGALLGGWPLAQGTVYLLCSKRFADGSAKVTIAFVAIVALLVAISPVNSGALEPTRPSGAILGWTWVRFMTPLLNSYAAVFLIGGAITSAVRYARAKERSERVWGNVLIAVGALMPGIGGTMAKRGLVEALYVLELAGLILIWCGYGVIVSHRRAESPAAESL